MMYDLTHRINNVITYDDIDQRLLHRDDVAVEQEAHLRYILNGHKQFNCVMDDLWKAQPTLLNLWIERSER